MSNLIGLFLENAEAHYYSESFSDDLGSTCGGSMGIFWFNWMLTIFFIALVVLGSIWLVRTIMSRDRRRDYDSFLTEKTVMDVLDEKYQKGDISKEKYKQLKKDLIKKK